MNTVRWIRVAVLAAMAIPVAEATKGVSEAAPGHFVPAAEEGLAAQYVGDRGIAADPDVIFTEDFEEGSLDAVASRWEEVKTRPIMSLDADVSAGSSGARSLLMTHVGGQSNGGHLYRRLLPGYNQAYLRFYVKFDSNCYPIHHFMWLGGYNPSTNYPQGGAGERPVGNERWTVGIEPFGAAWKWDFYTYWMEMRNGADLNYWGNDFINDPTLTAQRDRWICAELMVKMNDPVSERNGEQQLWIDGQSWERDGQITSHVGPGFPNGHWLWDSFQTNPADPPFEGFRWRNDEALNLNFLWLQLYITDSPEGRISKVWFDDVVVAKRYIGPIRTATLTSAHVKFPG